MYHRVEYKGVIRTLLQATITNYRRVGIDDDDSSEVMASLFCLCVVPSRFCPAKQIAVVSR